MDSPSRRGNSRSTSKSYLLVNYASLLTKKFKKLWLSCYTYGYDAKSFSGKKLMSPSEGSEDIWRSGNLLVMHKDAQLPDRCIKTNQPANGKRFKATLYWHHPAIYLFLFLNLLIYLVVAMIVRKKAIVYVGVTEKILCRRRRAILWGWLTGITGVILFFVSASIQFESVIGVLMLLSLGLMLGGLIGGIARATIVGVDRIDENYIWIRGVSKEYLALLPEWRNFNRI